jgi:ceramide glucosyltransferase
MILVLAGVTAIAAVVGVLQALLASGLVASFARTPREQPSAYPAVTVLKPLHGDEPLLEEALATLCRQHYPNWQIVFGVQDAADPAVAVVRRLEARFPGVDIELVVDPTLHGVNRKVGNLINMLPSARHEVLVIADSDLHVRPDYLVRLTAALRMPQVGLVTTLYAGLPVHAGNQPDDHDTRSPPLAPGSGNLVSGRVAEAGGANSPRPQPAVRATTPVTLSSRLGATQITHGFLPGAVLARAFGRRDCLGATMCLRREHLEHIGGFRALVDHLADDNVLGRKITALGLGVALADTVPLTTVPETTLSSLIRHELRWARTIRSLEPVGFAASVLQYPLAWALVSVCLARGAVWSIGLFCVIWLLRGVAAGFVDRALAPLWSDERDRNADAALAFRCPVWLLPLRDIMSVTVMLASYGGRHVEWRGHRLRANSPPPFTERSVRPQL